METIRAKVLVIGGGPGGYVAAVRCGQLGLDTVLVENTRLGGTCLTRGCIPSKALIHAAGQFHEMVGASQPAGRFGIHLAQPPTLNFSATQAWKNGVVDQLSTGVAALLKRAKVRVVPGWAHFSDAKSCVVQGAETVNIRAEHVILATGSTPVELASLPFGGNVINSTEALSLPEVPQRLLVVGAGYIGLELGIAFRKLGAQVTVVERQDKILPLYDSKLVEPVRRWLVGHDVTLHLNSSVRELDAARGDVSLEDSNGHITHLAADRVLVTIGRAPLSHGWGRENMGLAMDGKFVQVDDRCHTAMKNVWAIGDLVGEPMLAHKATAQGEMVAEIIAGQRRHFDPVAIPAVCFTDPEIVTVGLHPTDTAAANAIVSVFPFAANGRALAMGAGTEGGFVRIVASRADHRILGIQAVGPHVAELSGAFAQALEMGALLEDVAGTIYAHPTLSEAFHEAALGVVTRPRA